MKKAKLVIAMLAAATASVLSAAPAASAAYDCDASALRASVLGGAAVEPLVANRGAGTCQTASRTLAQLPGTLPLLSASAAVAGTSLTGDTPAAQKVLASGGLVSLKVKALPDLPISLPIPEISNALGAVTVPLLNVPLLLDPLVPASLQLDLRPAVEALLPDGKLPSVDVVSVDAAIAYAAGACVNGKPALAGASQIAGIRVLGQELPTNAVIDRAFTLVDTSSIDLSRLDTSLIELPTLAGVLDSVLHPLVLNSLEPVLDGLPDIQIPAALAQVKITPNEQTQADGRLTQRALRVQVGVLGRSLADLVVGEASVAESAVDCSEPEPEGAADATELTLACTTRRLVLTDVVAAGNRVKLLGAADKALAGQTAKIRLLATGKTVADAVIGPDGAFSATAPLPSKSIRSGNRARYQATLGGEKSLDLKLARRMVVTSMQAANGKVTIAGRVVGPLARKLAPIYVERRVSCSDSERVAKVVPKRDGRFRVTVDAPGGALAAVYRLETKVRKTAANPKLFPTYTLPRAVNLR